MNPDAKPTVFKGGAFIGKNWLFCSSGSRPLGELIFAPKQLELRLPWKKAILEWSQISAIRVRYGASIYIYHELPNVSPYLVFTPHWNDWRPLAECCAAYGFPLKFNSWI